MKKVIAVLFAALIMAFAAVPAFAAEGNQTAATVSEEGYQSPVATVVPDPNPPASPVNKDTSGSSPKTGSSDTAAYAVIALSLAAAGAATLVFVKSGKSGK